MIHVKQAVIVEGRYDKSKLSSLIDAPIFTTDGFDIFRDREKLALFRRLAERDGVILLTDSDAAGFRIRSYLTGALGPGKVIQVYIPDLFGKEPRKARPSAEGKLGVEGVPAGVLLEALRRAGADADETPGPRPGGAPVTKADLVGWGLSGGENSAELRRALLARLGLPTRLSANALVRVVNELYTREQFEGLLREAAKG